MNDLFDIVEDHLTGDGTRALLALHLQGMHATSPPGQVSALDLAGLKDPRVAVWSARQGDRVVGIGALKALDDASGEVKSMRTHPDYLRRGIAAALLEHMITIARARRWRRLSLETGSGPAFEPARQLYRGRGFVDGAEFSDYKRSSFSQFLHLSL